MPASRSRLRAAARGSTMAASAGRVGGDDEIVGEPALEPEAGNAEIGILVGEFEIARVVSGFRNAPGQAQLAGDALWRRTTRPFVPSSRLPAGARITSDGIRYSNIDPDHEISAAPCARGSRRGPDGTSGGREHRPWRSRGSSPAALPTPADRSNWVERAFGREAADRQQLALAVEEEAEIHGQRHRARLSSSRCSRNRKAPVSSDARASRRDGPRWRSRWPAPRTACRS